MKKKSLIMGLILAVIVCLLIPIIIYASSVVRPELSFDGATGKCMASITAAGKEIEAEMELKKGDVVIQNWKGNAKSALVLTGTCENCEAGVTYTLVVRGTVNGRAFAEKKVEGMASVNTGSSQTEVTKESSSESTGDTTEGSVAVDYDYDPNDPSQNAFEAEEEQVFRGTVLYMSYEPVQHWLIQPEEAGQKNVVLELNRMNSRAMNSDLNILCGEKPEKTQVVIRYKGTLEKDGCTILGQVTEVKAKAYDWYAEVGITDALARRIYANIRFIGRVTEMEETSPVGFRLETKVRYDEENNHIIDWTLYNDTDETVKCSTDDLLLIRDPVYGDGQWRDGGPSAKQGITYADAREVAPHDSISGVYELGYLFPRIPARYAKCVRVNGNNLVIYSDIQAEEFVWTEETEERWRYVPEFELLMPDKMLVYSDNEEIAELTKEDDRYVQIYTCLQNSWEESINNEEPTILTQTTLEGTLPKDRITFVYDKAITWKYRSDFSDEPLHLNTYTFFLNWNRDAVVLSRDEGFSSKVLMPVVVYRDLEEQLRNIIGMD